MLTKDFFSQTDLGKLLSEHCLDAVYPVLRKNSFEKHYEPGDVVSKIGERREYIIFVKTGGVKAYTYTPHGEGIFFYYFQAKSTIGLVAAISKSIILSQDIAENSTDLIFVPRDNLMNALTLVPDFAQVVLNLVCQNANRQIEISILSRRKYAIDRICMYLYLHHRHTKNDVISIPFTMEVMANYLGLTRSVLSKELHTLEKEGIIQLRKKEIQILDLESLESYI